MALKYHISPKTGAPAPCEASVRACPVGSEEEHYASPEAAREAFEASQAAHVLPQVKKRIPVTPAQQAILREQLSAGVLETTVRATTARLGEAYARLAKSPRWGGLVAEKMAFFRADIGEGEPRPPVGDILADRGITF